MGSALSRLCGRGDYGPEGWANNMGSALSRFCGRGDDAPGFLQLMQNQAPEGDSSGGDNDAGPELEPKHKIFLSHSGAQKDFTEQLCVDLERSLYYPFFDKRHDSLPKGKKFPELIFKAAQQCRVAVLVLSEEYFTRSKWPMLELESFVEAQMKDPSINIFPVYMGLSRDECTKNEARRSKWVSVWRKWAERGERINVEKWVEALRVLGSSNGIEYVQSLGEVCLREQIVNAIRRLVPPEIRWSAGQIEGRSRICKTILEKLRSTKPSTLYGVRVVGIYGTGGVGKTTFCKVMCDELSTEFQGRVCHGELGSKSQLEMHKQVLMGLTDINHDSLTSIWDDKKTENLLCEYLPRFRLFFALDNVWQDSIEKAKSYLQAGFHHDSIVMVTARSLDVLASLRISESDCLEMPELNEEDATQLFLHHAAPGLEFRNEVDEERIQYCVKLCKFQKGENMGAHFLPLALKVLGAQLGGLEPNPVKWVENLKNMPKDYWFNQFGEKEHPIFGVLRSGYDSLSDEDQHLFMDVVLFRPRLVSHSSRIQDHFVYDGVTSNYSAELSYYSSIDLFEWLSIVYKTEVCGIKYRVQGLKAKALIENMGDYGVSIHDLYIEFAKMEVQRGALDSRRWVWDDLGQTHGEDVTLMPCGSCLPNMKRVQYSIGRTENMGRIKWQHFCNIVVLNLFISKIEVLDLRGLHCLRSLGVEWYLKSRMEEKRTGGKIIGLASLKKLAWLALCDIGSASYFKEIDSLTTLKVLHLREDNFKLREPLSPPNLDKCTALRELVLVGFEDLKAFPDLSNLRNLKKIIFERCHGAKEVVGLNPHMHSMHVLMVKSCLSLNHIFGLGDLISLEELSIQKCENFKQLPNLCKLTKLQRLSLVGKFKEVVGFKESMPLYDLDVDGVEELPDLHMLKCLQRLVLWRFNGSILPQFNSLVALKELSLNELPKVCKFPTIDQLSRLRRLYIHCAPQLELEPLELGGLVALQDLSLRDCGSSIGRAELRDLDMLTNLEVLRILYTPIRSLPSLERLTQLRELVCCCTQLVEFPDLSALPALMNLNVAGNEKLERFPNLQPLALNRSGVRLSLNASIFPPETFIVPAGSKFSLALRG